MSVFKTTFSRALDVFPSDNCDIPFPNAIVSGLNDNTTIDRLIDTTKDFIALNVKQGDIVYNHTTGAGATVTRVSTSTILGLNADIFDSTGQSYTVYQASPQTGLSNQGCYLYIGESEGGKVTVTTIGGDIITFYGVLQGEVLPVQVIKLWVNNTAVAKILALW